MVLIWDDFLNFIFFSQKTIKMLLLLGHLQKAEMENLGYISRHLGVKILKQKGGEWLCMLEMLLTLKMDFAIIRLCYHYFAL